MIIDRTWNRYRQTYVISYLDENGNRKMWNRYMHHRTTYEYDENGKMMTWDGKHCTKVFKNASEYRPCEFDELEMLYGLEHTDAAFIKELHTARSPRTYYFDIETKYMEGQFPYPEKAEFEIVSISLVGPDGSCIVYGLHDLDASQKQRFKDRYVEAVKVNEYASSIIKADDIKVLYQHFDDERTMLRRFFTAVLPKISCLSGWNTYNFDLPYMINRIIRIFGKSEAYNMIKGCSPTGELYMMSIDDGFGNKSKLPTPRHTLWLDEMQLVKDYDYTLRPYENYSLDYVGERAVKMNKVKYTEHGLNELLQHDPETYYYYNAIDSLVVMLISKRLKCIESPCAVAALSLVPLLKAFGQVSLTTANLFREFYLDDKHVVYEQKNNVKIPYKGAFCACVPGHYTFSACSDFASLYPSQVRTCNFSVENKVVNMAGPDSLGRYTVMPWTEAELEQKRKDPNYFVTVSGIVYKNDKPYAFKRLMEKLMNGRKSYKYQGSAVEAELLPFIDECIAKKQGV